MKLAFLLLLSSRLLLADGKVKKKHVDHSKCRHGTLDNETGQCDCFEHWHTAGITDTIDFLEGVCEQYRCQDSESCQMKLGIPGASCPVPGWNCYCGWEYAWQNLGHGYETPAGVPGGAECMGIMYTFSIWSTEKMEVILAYAWILFVSMAVLMLPFGRKRAICDHHRPSLWLFFRSMCCPIRCDGQCVLRENYDMDWFCDDVAWTWFWMELGVWVYLFLAILYLIALFVWSVVLWLMVMLIMLVVLLSIACMGCMACLGECTGAGVDCCACGDCCNALAAGAHCNAGGALDCVACCHHCNPPVSGGASNVDAFYFNGSFPLDPIWGYSGHGHVGRDPQGVRQSGARCCGLCIPFAMMLYVFPAFPENAWGGLFGYYVLRTHAKVPHNLAYTGITEENRGSFRTRLTEFMRMGWLRTSDLHEETQWRQRVHDFVAGEDAGPAQSLRPQAKAAAGRPPAAFEPRSMRGQFYRGFTSQDATDILPGRDRNGNKVIRISHARVHFIDREFDQELDQCFQSSFEDYKKNICWICQSENDQWDMWTSCHHLFCQDCSTTMLKRRMPCPLCRVMSTTVLRGEAVGLASQEDPENGQLSSVREESPGAEGDEPFGQDRTPLLPMRPATDEEAGPV
mmetsp:Transcript_61245/g.145791  ORF Transcript_61245/g.145791 Transcript_61245/m.145791 type:complete len:628 (+) Transcript_61245:87-1970(+)